MTDNNGGAGGTSGKSATGSDKTDKKLKSISDLRTWRGTVTMQQTKLKNYIETPGRVMSLVELETRLGLLETYMTRFNEFQTKLEVEDSEEQSGDRRYSYEEVYIAIKCKLLSLIEELRPRVSVTGTTSFIHSSKPNANLPKLNIKPFSGRIFEWSDFYATFRTLVAENDDLTEVEKLAYLRGSLDSEPLQVINNINLKEDGFDNAISLLKSRYENKRLIFQGHIKSLFDLKPIEKSSVSKLRFLSDSINSHLRALKSIATSEQITDGLLLNLLGSKIDMPTKLKWEEEAPLDALPSLKDFSSFLNKRCQTLENAEVGKNDPARSYRVEELKSSYRGKPLQGSSLSANHLGANCFFCKSRDHEIRNCGGFRKLSPLERFFEVKRLSLCLNCLRAGHVTKNCKSSRCKYCSSKHNTLLHRHQSGNVRTNDVTDAPNKGAISPCEQVGASSTAMTSQIGSSRKVKDSSSTTLDTVLATALIDVEGSAGTFTPYRALLDAGSTSHFVSEKLVQQLRLKRSRAVASIDGIGLISVVVKHKVELIIRSRNSEFTACIEALVLPKIASQQPCRVMDTRNWKVPENIPLADPTFNTPQPIDVLIGAGLFYELLSVGQIRLGKGLPVLQKTLLGWIIGGGESWKTARCMLAVGASQEENYCLEESIRRFWEIEEHISPTRMLSAEETDCERHFLEHLKRDDAGRFHVRLPFQRSPLALGNSLDTAKKRFFTLEQKLSKNPDIQKQYSDFMSEYVTLGHMERVSSLSSLGKCYILPHHCVLKPESSTTKLRVVFDASCKTSSGLSLNDTLMVGPVIQDDLFDILLRFRSRKYAVTADISKMYRQVRVQRPDTDWQCILWRESPKAPLDIYRLLTVTYGTAPASYLATGCLRQLALEGLVEFPIGSQVLKRDFYVDDMLSGADSIEEARRLQREVDELLRAGGFELAKWCSNSPELLASFNKTRLEKYLHMAGDNFVKTLGMFWQPQDDVFRFFSQQSKDSGPAYQVTKRKVLSIISRLFDPLGLLNPIVVRAKIFLQQLWSLKLAWDESLPQELHCSWLTLYEQFSLVEQISIPRFVLRPSSYVEIHGFADASMAAYGACIYVRCIEGDNISCNLLTAKSRVAPLKTISIPRLELCAALLLAELVARVMRIFGPIIKRTHYWSDSTIVLSWLRSSPSKWSTFVSNRVSKIQELSQNTAWRHVPSPLNPADLVSRGSSPKELSDSELWFHGPDFLCLSEEMWPENSHRFEEQLPEKRKSVVGLLVSATDNLVESSKFCNSFVRLVNSFAYIYRFVSNAKTKDVSNRNYGLITTEEFERALLSIIRSVQRHYFKDYRALENRTNLKSNSVLKSLNAFVDSDGLIRVGGRLDNADLDYDAKHQIILPNCKFLKTLISHYHHKHLHVGCQALLAIIRTRYWPIGGRNTVKQVVRNCVRCSRIRPNIMEQLMGQLPSPRVQPSPVFYHTGLDFCGPFYIKHIIRNRAPTKAYICLFICLSVKAVHLEVVENLTTEAFLSAFIKFKARRPRVAVVYSDNATNFTGGCRELQDLYELFMSENHSRLVQEMCARDAIVWKFIPPRSPHFGGLWEAAVKQTKYHLRRVLGLQSYSLDELQRVSCQVESILNSRPLTSLSDDTEDLQALTPGHFLTGGPMIGVPYPTLVDSDIKHLSRWQLLQAKMQNFWSRWQKEYLQTLQRRTKWKNTNPDVKVGSLVLLKEDNLPPLKWALGRIQEIYHGPDGHVRVADVRTMSGTLKRSITKLCPLPVETSDSSSVLEDGTSKVAGLC